MSRLLEILQREGICYEERGSRRENICVVRTNEVLIAACFHDAETALDLVYTPMFTIGVWYERDQMFWPIPASRYTFGGVLISLAGQSENFRP